MKSVIDAQQDFKLSRLLAMTVRELGNLEARLRNGLSDDKIFNRKDIGMIQRIIVDKLLEDE